jgi:hypothetical protein
MTANVNPPWRKKDRRSAAYRGAPATGPNGQAAEEKISANMTGVGCQDTFLAFRAGRSVFHLTPPLIGLSHSYDGCWVNLKPDISFATKTGHFN